MRAIIMFALLAVARPATASPCEWVELTRSLRNAYDTGWSCGANGRLWRVTYTIVQRDTCFGDIRSDEFSLEECRERGAGACFDYTECGACDASGWKRCQAYRCDGTPVGSSYGKRCER